MASQPTTGRQRVKVASHDGLVHRMDSIAGAEATSCGTSAANVVIIFTHSFVLFVLVAIGCSLLRRRYRGELDASETLLSSKEKPPRIRMPHLDSLRFIFALLVVLFHYDWLEQEVAAQAGSPLDESVQDKRGWPYDLISWATAYVSYFIVLSGFVTEWTTAPGLALAPCATLGKFYAKRLTRVLLITWITLTYMLTILAASEPARLGSTTLGLTRELLTQTNAGTVIAAYLQLYSWWQPWMKEWTTIDGSYPTLQHTQIQFFSVPMWTIGVLVPCWLLYPASQWLVQRIEDAWGALGLVGGMLTMCAIASTRVLALKYGGVPTGCEFISEIDHTWAPTALGDFLIGILAAALARRHAEAHPRLPHCCGLTQSRYSVRGVVADVLAVAIGLLFMLVNMSTDVQHNVHEVSVKLHLFSLPFACYIYASVGNGGIAGVVALGLSNRALELLGQYSLTIYLLQWPFFNTLISAPELIPDCGWLTSGMWALVLLLGLSIACTELVEKPLTEIVLGMLGARTLQPSTSTTN